MRVLFVVLIASLGCAVQSASIGDRVLVNFFAKARMPLNSSAAEAEGWTRVGGADAPCSSLYGHRYRMQGRVSPTMLYDHMGQVAGMQFGVESNYPLYPKSNVVSPPYFKDDSSVWSATMHFTDPAQICSNTSAAVAGSIGDRLWARESENGNTPENFYSIPLTRGELYSAARATDGWVAAGCLISGDLPASITTWGMGQHFWRTFGERTQLRSGYPWFLLYDQNDNLNMFGIQIAAVVNAYPTPSGKATGIYVPPTITDKTPEAPGPGMQLWTYPIQPLIPFFHLKGEMPRDILYINQQDPTMPCGTFTTGTSHVIIRDSSSITEAACHFNRSDPSLTVNGPGTTAAEIRAAYGAPGPFQSPPGIWNFDSFCREEVTLASPPSNTNGDGDDDMQDVEGYKATTLAVVGILTGVFGIVIGGAFSFFMARRAARLGPLVAQDL